MPRHIFVKLLLSITIAFATLIIVVVVTAKASLNSPSPDLIVISAGDGWPFDGLNDSISIDGDYSNFIQLPLIVRSLNVRSLIVFVLL